MGVTDRRGVVLLAAALAAGGCAINAEPDFDSALPQDRFLAIRQAEARGDTSALPDLVRQLSSDDPVVRIAAIDALDDLTGKRLGYDPLAPEIERSRAIGRWTEWLESEGASAGAQEAAR